MNDTATGIAGLFLFIWLGEWLIVIVACMVIGREKNRNGFLWGFFLNLIGLIVIAILPPLEPKQSPVPASKISNQGEEKPRIKIGWFVLYFLLFAIVIDVLIALVLVDVLGWGDIDRAIRVIFHLISIIVAVYFASKLSRK